MPKLVLFTRSSLVFPTQDKRSPFNAHPEVLRHLAWLRINSWRLAIVSNESAGRWAESTAKNLAVGDQVRVKAGLWFCDDFYTVKVITIGRFGVLKVESLTQSWLFNPEEPVLIRSKTIESTIKELTSIAELCGITDAVFCPVLDGKILHAISHESGWGWRSKMIIRDDCWMPGPGMLTYLKNIKPFRPRQCVIIGETAQTYTAADRAGFKFVYAEDWRNDRVTVE